VASSTAAKVADKATISGGTLPNASTLMTISVSSVVRGSQI
jgi:hypothetical protein